MDSNALESPFSQSEPKSSPETPQDLSTDSSVVYHGSFNDPNADVVLISRDNIRFRVHQIILRNTSSFFRSMFTLPQSTNASPSKETLLHLDDDSMVVETVLRMVCGAPLTDPNLFDSFDTVEALLHFCDKYGMPGPISYIQASITRPSLLKEPFRLYKLACQYSWAEVHIAAIACLDRNPVDPASVAQLHGISFENYARLLDLVRRRRDDFQAKLDDPVQFHGSDPAYTCRQCGVVVLDLAWKVLRLVLVRELERCPSGATIKAEAFMQWPEMVETMASQHCDKRLYDPRSTRAKILEVLNTLPTDLQ